MAQQTIYENPQYTEDALIIQAILEYSIDVGTEDYFIRKDITEDHYFQNIKNIKYFQRSKISPKNTSKEPISNRL